MQIESVYVPRSMNPRCLRMFCCSALNALSARSCSQWASSEAANPPPPGLSPAAQFSTFMDRGRSCNGQTSHCVSVFAPQPRPNPSQIDANEKREPLTRKSVCCGVLIRRHFEPKMVCRNQHLFTNPSTTSRHATSLLVLLYKSCPQGVRALAPPGKSSFHKRLLAKSTPSCHLICTLP